MKINIGAYKEDRVVEINIDPWDSWNADTTLAMIIAPVLKQLRDTSNSYPSGLTPEEWDRKLNKMIAAFEKIAEGSFEYDKDTKKGLKLFAKYYEHLWD